MPYHLISISGASHINLLTYSVNLKIQGKGEKKGIDKGD